MARRFSISLLAVATLVSVASGELPLFYEDGSSDFFGADLRGPPHLKEVHRKGDAEFYRLPSGITPVSYDIKLIPFLEEGNFSLMGEVKIMISVQEGKNEVTFHSKNLAITEEKLYDVEANAEVAVVGSEHDEERDFHILHLKEPLSAGKHYIISMKFEGKLNEALDGFYRAFYRDDDGNKRWMAVTHFEATRAREAFPCFDEPHLKAKFTISLARDKEMSSISNMNHRGPPETDLNLPPTYVWDHYEETPKMSTYLIAFIVSDFKFKESESGNFRVWARENAIDQVDYSLKVGPMLLDAMHKITNIEFALPKMDMIAIPDFEAGAMENWGLVTFRETALLFKDGTSTPNNRQRVATVVAHELAHQWFGNLVSPEWWKFTWLNEGFATYFECAATDMIEPSWRLMEQFVVQHLHSAFLTDALKSTHPITSDLSTPDEISSVFDEISYSKAGSVLRMMANSLSTKTFYRGLERYLTNRKFNSGSDIQLFEGLNAQAQYDSALPEGVDVGSIMKTWTKQVGYPVITVERNYEDGHAHIMQERFVLDDASKGDVSRWWVPLTYATKSAPDFTNTVPSVWMPKHEKSIVIEGLPGENEWVIFNVQQSGYYRVNYDENNWRLIIGQLLSKNFGDIHPVNRAQLIDDSLNLARGGYLHYDVALDLTRYLAQETDFIPWYSAYQGFSFLDSRLSTSATYPKYKLHMLELINTHYKAVNFKDSPQDDHVKHLSRSMLLPWACKYQHQECLASATHMFTEWKLNTIPSIPANLKGTVYCYGVASGGQEEWEFMWEKFKSTTVATEEALIMSALGCTKDKAILKRYLQGTIADEPLVRRQDRASVLAAVYVKPEGFEIATNFLIENFDKIKEKYTSKSMSNILKGISSRISSKEQATKMTQFLESQKGNLGDAERSAKQAIQTIENNMRWMNRNVPAIENWLNEKFQKSEST